LNNRRIVVVFPVGITDFLFYIVSILAFLRERGHWRDQDVGKRIILRWIFRKLEGVVGTGWVWLRIGTDGGHLWVR
jgi:hypothetical protein